MLVNEDEYFRGQVEGDILYGVQGPPGPAGKSAYAYAKENGYTGSESDFSRLLGQFPERVDTAVQKAETAAEEAYKAIEALDKADDSIVETSSGEVISLTDCAERPLRGLKVFGKTTQNGTPAPEAPVPLESVGDDGSVAVTVCGKNLFSGWESGRLSSTNGTEMSSATGVRTKFIPIPLKKNICISGLYNNLFSFCAFYNAEKQYLGRTSADRHTTMALEVPYAEAVYIRLTSYEVEATDGVIADIPTDIQVELGSIATEYEPYKEVRNLTITTPNGLPGLPVTSGGNYTDGSGQQWLCDEVDFEKGVYVQRVANKIFNGTEAWIDPDKNNRRVQAIVDYDIISPINNNTIGLIVCTHLLATTASKTYSGEMGCSIKIGERAIHCCGGERTASVEAWKQFLSEQYANGTPVSILVGLKTPIETALSAEQLAAFAALHTSYPNTTVFNEEGAGMEVKYVADTKLYIDKKFDQLAAAMLNN